MARTDIHLDAMLRHLGAAYYESLHGRVPRTDVTRALETVEEHLRDQPAEFADSAKESLEGSGPMVPGARDGNGPRGAVGKAGAADERRRRYARRVRDVMTTEVITINRMTPYKEIAKLLSEHRVSGLPVLTTGKRVVGVVTEADLLAAEEEHARKASEALGEHERHGIRAWRRHGVQPVPVIAGDLMTSPVVTIHPDATISSAARVMNTNRVRRLPVVDHDGRLIGVVSRRDLLTIFLRPDNEIVSDAQLILDEILLAKPRDIQVSVRNGVVALAGTFKPTETHDSKLVQIAIRLISDIDGVVEVVNRLTLAKPESDSAQQPA